MQPQRSSTLFPYTTLFRSRNGRWRNPGGAQAAAPSDRRIPEIAPRAAAAPIRSEEHTSELQSRRDLVCRLLLEKKNDVMCTGKNCFAARPVRPHHFLGTKG